MWSRGLVMIGNKHDFADQILGDDAIVGGVAVVNTPSGPALLVSGEDPTAAIALLNSRWQPLADYPTLAVNMLEDGGAPGYSLSFEDLGIALQNSELDDRVQFDTIFSSDQLPRGSHLKAIRVDLALGAAPTEANATIFAFLNGRLLGSRIASGAVPTSLSLSVPDGLLGRDNALSVRIQRPPRVGACTNPAPGQPVQLLPSSTLELSPAGSAAKEFFDLAPAFREGLDVSLPVEPLRLQNAMVHLIAVGLDLLPDAAPINVRLEARPTLTDRPFIAVSGLEPEGANPRVRFDQGALTISRSDGKVLVELADADNAPTIAQVLNTENAVGLWLRPGKTLPGPNAEPVRLDRGDVAAIDKAGIALAFSTERKETVSVAYHEIRSWADIASEYRPWIVGAVWLVLTMLFVTALSRIYRRRGSK